MSWARAATLRNYGAFARSMGLDPDALLQNAGLDPADLTNPETPINAERVMLLLEESAIASGCPQFGLRMAEMRSVAQLGPLALLLSNQRNLRDRLQTLVAFQHVLGDTLSLTLEELDEGAILRIQLITKAQFPPRQTMEYVMGSIAFILRSSGGQAWVPESAHFLHRAPDDRSFHQRMFQSPLAFESVFNGLTFSNASLDLLQTDVDPEIARYARDFLDTVHPKPGDASILPRARRALYLLLPEGRAKIDDVAHHLATHVRTLQRLLEREGSSYSELLNEVRRELVVRHLANQSHSLSTIAGLLGYASLSSFTRWFVGQYHVSPSAWRATLPAPGSVGAERRQGDAGRDFASLMAPMI